ncbi:MAG: peptidyl-tRNA hydrolase Pth2 [archaeon]|nr:peptidyl-tRNA hydrolase Pth2 [archaeon]
MNLTTRAPDEEYKIVIVVRTDLKMSSGKIAVQVAHAAVNCAIMAEKKHFKEFNAWYSEGQKKIVLRVDSLEELYKIKAEADARTIDNCLIADAGRTEIIPGSITCIGLGPSTDSILNIITGDLSLL